MECKPSFLQGSVILYLHAKWDYILTPADTKQEEQCEKSPDAQLHHYKLQFSIRYCFEPSVAKNSWQSGFFVFASVCFN